MAETITGQNSRDVGNRNSLPSMWGESDSMSTGNEERERAAAKEQCDAEIQETVFCRTQHPLPAVQPGSAMLLNVI